jgi:hypothetical protein
MDEETKAYLDAMMALINNGTERILEQIRALSGDLRDLRSEHSVTRTLVTELPATVLGAIEGPLLRRIRSVEDRVTKLEKDTD